MQLSLDWRDIERMAAVQLAVIHAGLGCSIIAGGNQRFSRPSYDALLDMTGDRAWPYGLMFIGVAVLLAVPHHKVEFVGHWAGVIALNVFSGLFFLSMVKYPTASATAWWIYFAFGTIHGLNLALMMVRRRRNLYQVPPGGSQREGA